MPPLATKNVVASHMRSAGLRFDCTSIGNQIS